jgi:hypothetical protein
LNGIYIGCHPADQISRLRLIVVREREPLHMGVEQAAQIVGNPLTDTGGEVLLRVGADSIQERNNSHRTTRGYQKLENCESAFNVLRARSHFRLDADIAL